MKKRMMILLASMVLVGFCSPSFAGEQGDGCMYKGPKPTGQVNMSNGGVYAKGKLGIILKTKYFKKDDIYNGSDSRSDYTGSAPGTGCREQERWVTQLTIRYGLFDNMDVRVMVPYWQKNMVRGMMKSGTLTQVDSSNDGFGDMVLMGRYKLMSQKKGNPFNLALGAGIKIPTGDTDELDDAKTNGSCFGSGFQSGTGSWDPKVEIAANRMILNWRMDATVMATFPTEGDLDYEYGNKIQYNLGSSVAVSNWLDLQLEYNGIWKDNSEDNGDTVDSSGGHWGYITPGFHIKFSRKPNIHLDFGVPILVFKDLNGEQLAEDYQFVAKLAVKF